MKAEEYRQMSIDELDSRLDDLRRHLFDLKAQAVTETLENCKAGRNVRRDIARLMTIIQQRSKNEATVESSTETK